MVREGIPMMYRGRTAHECIFNVNDGNYRCPNAQQGFSGFTTWTRGLAWAMCGFAEELEYIEKMPRSVKSFIDKEELMAKLLKAAIATADFYIEKLQQMVFLIGIPVPPV